MKLLPIIAAALIFFSTGGNANPVLIQNDDVTSNCPPGYSQPAFSSANKCYKVYTTYKSRKDAATQCRNDNGTLASIPDGFTNSNIYSQAKQASVPSLWLGIQCFNGDSKSCTTDDNSNFVYSNFAPGQPTTQDTCLYMSTIGRDTQQWSTFDCEQTFQFACEVAAGSGTGPTAGSPTTTTQKTGSCPTYWTAFQGMCYRKFDTGGVTRDQQSAECKETAGGNLVTITSQAVDSFLASLYCPNQYLRIGLSCPNTTSVGNTSTCVWDDGTSFSYNNFAAGQPVPSASPNCAYEYFGVWYNNYPCDQRFECSACQAPMQ